MLLDGCNDSCGWVAAVVSALAYGTYGVPVKEAFRVKTTPTKSFSSTATTVNNNRSRIMENNSIQTTTRKRATLSHNNDNMCENDTDSTEVDLKSDMSSLTTTFEENLLTNTNRIEKTTNTTDTTTTPFNVNPFVFQSYKTAVMFVTCWFVLLLGVKIRFTPWGIVSGFLWVVGGTFGIIGVKYAGMATAVGTWASVMIGMNFIWGILIFQEPVHDMISTTLAFILLTLGLVGMSVYSTPTNNSVNKTPSSSSASSNEEQQQPSSIDTKNEIEKTWNETTDDPFGTHLDITKQVVLSGTTRGARNRSKKVDVNNSEAKSLTSPNSCNSLVGEATKNDFMVTTATTSSELFSKLELDDKQQHSDNQYEDEYSEENGDDDGVKSLLSSSDTKKSKPIPINPSLLRISLNNVNQLYISIIFFCKNCIILLLRNKDMFVWKKRTIGIAGAVMNGIMTGSSLIPMHYAKKDGYGGANYMISYATGAMICNVSIWLLYFVLTYIYHYYKYEYQQGEDSSETYVTSSSLLAVVHQPTESSSSSSSTKIVTTIAATKSDANSGVSNSAITSTCTRIGIQPQTTVVATAIWYRTIQSMPSFHFDTLWLPGIIAGLFLSVAMFGSLLAVTYLGQAIGNSVIQSKILISGMWGIFWYKEIDQPRAIMMWFLSASCTVIGIIWLSQQRLSARS